MRYKNAMSASTMALLPKLDKHQKTWHVPEQASPSRPERVCVMRTPLAQAQWRYYLNQTNARKRGMSLSKHQTSPRESMCYENAISASAMALLPKLDKRQKAWHVPEQT